MRIVYDDAMEQKMVWAVGRFMETLHVEEIVVYEWRMDRVSMTELRVRLNRFLRDHRLRIGEKAVHAYGIGNKCRYPVYYSPEGLEELQQCGSINLNTGLYGEGYVSCVNYNGKRVGAMYEVRKEGVIKK